MKSKKLWLGVTGLISIVLLSLTFVIQPRSSELEAWGTVEAREIHVGSKVGGRIQEVLVREGDRVEKGQTLVRFEDLELEADLAAARARHEQARINLRKMERGYRPEEVTEAKAQAARAEADWKMVRVGYREEQVEQVRAELEAARALALNARRTYERYRQLWNDGVYSRQRFDDVETRWKAAVATEKAAEERLAELEKGYRAEEVASAEARYLQMQAYERKISSGFRREDVEAAHAALALGAAELRQAESRYRERLVRAPADATVEVLGVRPGDLIAPRSPVATLLESDQLYVRIFIPETEIGRIQVGQSATFRVDSFPGRDFTAVVEQVNNKAEFLPRNVQTRRERVHLVFGVKLRIDDPEGRIKPGMAVEARLIAE